MPIPKAIPYNTPDKTVFEIKAISKTSPSRGAHGKIPIKNPKTAILKGVLTISFSLKIAQSFRFGSLPKIIRRATIITNTEKKVLMCIWKFPVNISRNFIETVATIVKNTYPVILQKENIKMSKNADFQFSFAEAKYGRSIGAQETKQGPEKLKLNPIRNI